MNRAEVPMAGYTTKIGKHVKGLEVEALGGEPGVHSARYAEGTDHDSEANMRKLLANLEGKDNRD